MEDEEAKRIQEERDKQLTEEYKELQNPKRPDEKQLLGSQLLDNIGGKFAEAGSAVMDAAQEDPDTWTDDAIRIGLGGVKNVGTVLSAPGIKQGLQLLGAPAYYVGRGLGYGLEKAGVDPRYGHIVGEVGEWFIPGYGMYKAAGKIVKGTTGTIKKVQAISQADEFMKARKMQLAVDLQMNINRNIDNVPGIVRRTMAWESGLKDGVFNYDIWKSNQLYGQTYRSRKTAEVIATPFEKGVEFEKYRDNIAMPAFKAEWKPILKKLDINESNLELHHIMAVKASVGLYDGLKYGSKEWNDVTTLLLDRYVNPGNIPENLMPVVGSRTDIGTPHYIAHKYLDDMVGPIGEKFFTPEIRRQMRGDRNFRLKMTDEYADIVKKSENIIVQAQEIWDLSYKGDIPEELVEKLSQIPASLDVAYQPPQLRNMIQTAIDDLDAKPLRRGVPNALQDVFDRIEAGQKMIIDLIKDPNLTSSKAIKKHRIKDPRSKQLVLKAVKSIKQLTPQEVTRIMKAYDKGGKGGTPR